MTREELDLAVKWAASEGWNPGIHDAECFFDVDPAGFFVSELDGKVIATVSAPAYDDSFGFAGFYMVSPEQRGKGYGFELAQKALSYLGDQNVGIDGVVAQQENYKKIGFKIAHRNIRYQTTGKGEIPQGLVPVSDVPFEDILRLDRLCFPAPRSGFLRQWITRPGTVALAKMEEGKLSGFGVLRPCLDGFKIGPLFAQNAPTADLLFRGLAAHAKGEKLFLDVPETNPQAVELAEKYKMEKVFETARMYNRMEPDLKMEYIFGITSFELG
jgi:ribosomal protein S18 acetylase RimI-like enzyme